MTDNYIDINFEMPEELLSQREIQDGARRILLEEARGGSEIFK